MQIIKRNGKVEEFNVEKIKDAIAKAYDEVEAAYDENMLSYLGKEITKYCYNGIEVEEIQNIVETILMKENTKVAQAYIRYRYKREIVRHSQKDFFEAVGKKIKGEDIQNQNANMDEHSFGGRMGEANSLLMKKYALDNLVSKKARENHEGNRIYIHDLDSYAVGNHNCLTCPIDDLLEKGFNTRQTDIRPAKSVSTAFQLLAVIFQIQSLQQFGGVSCSHLDWTMVPYVRLSFFKHYQDGLKYIEKLDQDKIDEEIAFSDYIDARNVSIEDISTYQYEKAYLYAFDMTEREIKQAVEAMFHNLNSLQSRSGNQLPFSSVNMGSCTILEGRLIIKAILQGCINGVGKLHRTSIFPCLIFQVKKGINLDKGDPNYDLFQLALKSTAKRLYPNYVNCDWSGNVGHDPNDPCQIMSTMGCRTMNGYDINGFGYLKDGRGNICPVTIILPTLAMEAKLYQEQEPEDKREDIRKTFLSILDKAIFDAKDMLIERYKYICSQNAESAKFMYENGTMKGYIPEKGIESALKHGTLALGLR